MRFEAGQISRGIGYFWWLWCLLNFLVRKGFRILLLYKSFWLCLLHCLFFIWWWLGFPLVLLLLLGLYFPFPEERREPRVHPPLLGFFQFSVFLFVLLGERELSLGLQLLREKPGPQKNSPKGKVPSFRSFFFAFFFFFFLFNGGSWHWSILGANSRSRSFQLPILFPVFLLSGRELDWITPGEVIVLIWFLLLGVASAGKGCFWFPVLFGFFLIADVSWVSFSLEWETEAFWMASARIIHFLRTTSVLSPSGFGS